MNNIWLNIKKVRELRNFTQGFVAEQLKMTQAGYSKIEAGQVELTLNRLDEIAKILKTSILELMNFDEQKIFNNHFDNVNQNTTNGNIYSDKEVLQKLEKQYEARIADLKQEVDRLHTLLQKALTK
jgi:transcriptional regulator with XRE-family HTH domain